MKKAIFDKLEDIPEADRGDYNLVTSQGSPNFNKYVLDLDPQHPVAIKNTELISEKSRLEAPFVAQIQQKDAEIVRLTGEVAVAKSAPTLPAGHVAIDAAAAQFLNEVRPLGDLKTIKEKLDEHGTLKADQELQTKKEKLTEIAERNGLEPKAFVQLALVEKLDPESFETTEIADAKGDKLKHDFVKGKDAGGAETKVAVGEYVKQSETFKPFLGSLYLSEADKKKIKIPQTKVGGEVEDEDIGAAYINQTYKRPDKKEKE